MNTIIRKLLCLSVLCLFSSVASAEIAVIVNPANSNPVSKEKIAKLFLGKSKVYTDGTVAVPIDRPEGSSIRVRFVKEALSKDESQLKSYWSRLVFTGKGVPPRELDTDAKVKDFVSKNPDAIGYIDSSAVDSKVKVVATY